MSFLLAAFITFQDEKAAPKIAEIESYAGTVELVDAKKASRAVTKFGRRLKNSDVRDEDTVKTSAGSQAIIVFPDRSRYTLKEKSEVQILQKELPKPTPEGNTIGRRLRLLVGNLTSEVMPNTEIRTDFETPAGSAAVRGTVLALSYDPARKSMRLSVDAGKVRYFNEAFSTILDVLHGSAVRFTVGSLDIQVEAGAGIQGTIGGTQVQLDMGDHVLLTAGVQAIDVGVLAGNLDVFNSNTNAFQPTNQNFQAPPTDAARQEATIFDPMAPTFAPPFPPPMLPAPPPMMPLPLSTDEPSPEDRPFFSPYLAQLATFISTSENFTSTSSSTTSSTGPGGPTFPILIDDFNRANGPVGNGWTIETGGTWLISANRLVVSPNIGIQEHMARGIGNLPIWAFKTTFNLSSATTDPFLEVNGAASPLNGCHAVFVPGTLTLKIGDATGLLNSTVVSGTFGTGADFVLVNSFDGNQICASISGAGVSGTVCKAGSSFS